MGVAPRKERGTNAGKGSDLPPQKSFTIHYHGSGPSPAADTTELGKRKKGREGELSSHPCKSLQVPICTL